MLPGLDAETFDAEALAMLLGIPLSEAERWLRLMPAARGLRRVTRAALLVWLHDTDRLGLLARLEGRLPFPPSGHLRELRQRRVVRGFARRLPREDAREVEPDLDAPGFRPPPESCGDSPHTSCGD